MPDTIIMHPTTGLQFFGLVQEKKVGKIIIPGAPIVLKRGKQSGNGGFGVRHIWARHEKEVRARGYKSVDEVPLFVADIVRAGSPIFCEFAMMRNTRVTVVRTPTGVAVLEYKSFKEGDDHYSVVTAFSPRNSHGTRIGSVAEYVVKNDSRSVSLAQGVGDHPKCPVKRLPASPSS